MVFQAENVHAFADRKRKQSTFEIHVRGDRAGAVVQAEVLGCVRARKRTSALDARFRRPTARNHFHLPPTHVCYPISHRLSQKIIRKPARLFSKAFKAR